MVVALLQNICCIGLMEYLPLLRLPLENVIPDNDGNQLKLFFYSKLNNVNGIYGERHAKRSLMA